MGGSIKSGLEKSYSEVAAPNQKVSGSNVISPETLKTVAKQVIVEEQLCKNIMIFGLPKGDDEDIQTSV